MQIKKPGIPAAKRHILAHLLLGILLITGITCYLKTIIRIRQS